MSTNPIPPVPHGPKSSLEGQTLASGWKLVERLSKPPGATGGNFGVGYRAVRGNEIAFVKAIDFVAALSAEDPITELRNLTSIATFEKEVLEYCTSRRMSRVLRYFGHEYISWDGSGSPMSRVSCLIMESGTEDLRCLFNGNGPNTCAWNLHVMADAAAAIAQLHRAGIAHQDIKPSNVIKVPEQRVPGRRELMKVGDLGRVVRKDQTGPFDTAHWPGDVQYSPPERWYGFVPPDWVDSREASDAYMLGSLLVFLFTGMTLQALLEISIPPQFRPDNWAGAFDDALLMSVLVDAHARVLHDHLLPDLTPELADGIIEIARNLTHPDPRKRGDVRARGELGRPVGIERLQHRLMLLATRAASIDRGRRQK